MDLLSKEDTHDFETLYAYLRVESEDLPERADAVVVGGSGTRIDMADRAAELYHRGRAPILVFSGFSHPKFDINEAELLSERAKELGVPQEALICEPRATNTGLNILLAERELRSRGLRVEKVILVHKPYMTRRFLATAQAQWPHPQPEVYVTSVSDTFLEYYRREKELGLEERMLRSMLKDYAVMKTHPELGFQSPQPHSEMVESAYQRLIKRGYSEQTVDASLATDHFDTSGMNRIN